MIRYVKGNLLESEAQALVNTVNTVGVMGKGIALQFKNQFPQNFKEYINAYKSGNLQIGKLLITEDISLLHGKKLIINFPTKTDWRKPSEYIYIESGLKALIKTIQEKQINSIAIPPLGAGNGGLEWQRVRELIEKYLSDLECEILLYEPDDHIRELLRKDRVALSPARAMLLTVLYDLVKQGEFVSEFSAEKVCYFLQRFGGDAIFRLEYHPNFYGPYSGKVKHVLHYLNGSFITGYSSKDKKPFEELNLLMDTEAEVIAYLSTESRMNERVIVEKTIGFLDGFYSNFGLELLSTLDFIAQKIKSTDLETIKTELSKWSNRKTQLFHNEVFLEKGIEKLKTAQLI